MVNDELEIGIMSFNGIIDLYNEILKRMVDLYIEILKEEQNG